jgi:hypothetical protein
VRRTGSDRRQRLPVPRKQHRHEQLQPLHRPIRSFSRTPSSRQENDGKARSADGSAFLAAHCGVPLEYPACTPSHSARLGGRSARAPPRAVPCWPQLPWPWPRL